MKKNKTNDDFVLRPNPIAPQEVMGSPVWPAWSKSDTWCHVFTDEQTVKVLVNPCSVVQTTFMTPPTE
eukprot:10062567-Prorocentrum_lima.AAC.1